MPRLSICVPTYNNADFVGMAIESALSQEYGELEVLVLDNASTDRTPEVVGRIKDRRVRYVRNATNVGFPRNLARGLELSRGEFLQFLCADDYLRPRYLEETVDMLETHPFLAFVHTAHDVVDASGRIIERRVYPWDAVLSGREFLKQLLGLEIAGVCLSSVLIRRALLTRAGGVDLDFECAADYGIWMRLCMEGNVGYLQEPLVAYRVHQGQLTSVLVPGERLKLVEKCIEYCHRQGAHNAALEDKLLARAVNERVRELSRSRMGGAPVSAVLSYALDLVKRYRAYIRLGPAAVHVFLSLLPPSLLKFARRCSLPVRRD